jgi:hypothetical protein
MRTVKPEPGQPGGAPFKAPAKNTSRMAVTQTIVALRGELKQLTTDLEAIAAGEAGSTFAKGDKAKLKARIASLKSILAKLEI